MIHYITPADKDKEFIKAANCLIDSLPNNDWVCMRDIDTVPLLPTQVFTSQVEELTKSGFVLIGAIMNRQGLDYLTHEGISENSDIDYHVQIAKDRHEMFGSQVTECVGKQTVAGAFMLFPAWLWKIHAPSKLNDKGVFYDYRFSNIARTKGKIGYAKGVYLFHLYRWGMDNPSSQTSHLE